MIKTRASQLFEELKGYCSLRDTIQAAGELIADLHKTNLLYKIEPQAFTGVTATFPVVHHCN